MSARREFSKEHKRHMLRRAMAGTNVVRCEGCGCDLTGKAFEFDHTIPEALVVDKSRAITPDDGKLLGKECCHRSEGGKTASDMQRITKARRLEAKSIVRRPQIHSRGFDKAPPQRSASRLLSKWYGWRAQP